MYRRRSRSTHCASSCGRPNCCVTKDPLNRLIAIGLRSHVPLTRLLLTPQHCLAQLLWRHERVNWRVEWRSVVFSDESRFCLYASDGHTRVCCRPSERHLPECIHSRHIGPTSGFIVWWAISYNSRSNLVFLQGKVSSAPLHCTGC